MQRRCPKPLKEVRDFREAWSEKGLELDGEDEATQRASVEVLLEAGPMLDGRKQRQARRELEEIQRRFRERDIEAKKDGQGPGVDNPHVCPWIKAQQVEAARWLDLVTFDGWGTPQSLTGTPLEDPILYWEAAQVIGAARSSATESSSKGKR